MAETVLIAGGTGLIGSFLSPLLRGAGYTVLHLSRTQDLEAEFPAYHWDIQRGELDLEALERADYVINLAGAGIADKLWTKDRRRVIVSSRVDGALLFKEKIKQCQTPPKAYLSASAIGYYGDRGTERLTVESAPGTGFLASTTLQWENAIREVAETGVRTAWLRTGIVLSTKGGALQKIMLPFKAFIGSYFGDGSQYYSWIHIEDIARMYLYLINHDGLAGAFNGTAPHPETNKELTYKVRTAIKKTAIVAPVPEAALRLGMGDMADTVMGSSLVLPERITSAGFEFMHPELLPALRDLLARKI